MTSSSINPSPSSQTGTIARPVASASGNPPLSGRGVPRAARLGLQLLGRIRGQLTLSLPDGQAFVTGQPGSGVDAETRSGQWPAQALRPASVKLNNWRVFQASLRNGDIGFAQSYIDGDWQTDSLVDTLQLLTANRQVLEQAIYGNLIGRLVHRLSHLLNRNTRRGARKNIHAHYDLGNTFYALWLDHSMTYSSALFRRDASSLEQAQQEKYQRIVDELALPAGANILEVGCGWGGFAELAASRGARVRGLTLSGEQLAFANERIDAAGLSEQVSLGIQDYRDEEGRYDGIASIEMFEAVGQAYWNDYFRMLRRCLKPGARAVVQTITIADDLFDRYARGSDFIQQYIFPGGMLPSPSRFEALASANGLKITNRLAFGKDYASTLAHWHKQFDKQLPTVRTLGFDEKFIRTWRFYLAYCEAAFNTGNTDVYQFTLTHDKAP